MVIITFVPAKPQPKEIELTTQCLDPIIETKIVKRLFWRIKKEKVISSEVRRILLRNGKIVCPKHGESCRWVNAAMGNRIMNGINYDYKTKKWLYGHWEWRDEDEE